jgi:ferredoxin
VIEITFVTNGGKVVSAPENSNLLRVSLREKGGIPFKCGGGLCGTCRCRIESGLAHTDAIKPKERKHLTDEEFAQGWRMACQTFVGGDVSVSWVPLEQRVRAAGTSVPAPARAPTPDPAPQGSTPPAGGADPG